MAKSLYKKTDNNLLISKLRCEVGEIIESWTLMSDFNVLTEELGTDDYLEDMKNIQYTKAKLIKQKFQDDIISRLAELAHKSYGKVNFYFATDKLNALKSEFSEYLEFIVKNNLKAQRDEHISHKNLPADWHETRAEYRIDYETILKAIAKALILMKKIDRIHLGEESDIRWLKNEVR